MKTYGIKRNMKTYRDYLEERPVVSASKMIPNSAPVLKKLIDGGYAQKIKGFSSAERLKFTVALEELLKALE